MMIKVLSVFVALFVMMGCTSGHHYSYSSNPKKSTQKVQTTIKTLELVQLNGVNIKYSDSNRWDFKVFLRDELKKQTFIDLSSNSQNKLYIKASISPIKTKRWKNRVFKIDQFHIKKSISMLSHYEIRDRNGKIIMSDVQSIDTEKSEIANDSYESSQRKHFKNQTTKKLHKELMQRLAKSVVLNIVDEIGDKR